MTRSTALRRMVAVGSCALLGSAPSCGRKTDIRPPELVAPKTISQVSLNSTPEGVLLRWSRPTETVDGKTMDDLAGFVIERAVTATGFGEIARVPVTDRGRFQKVKRFEHLDRDVVPGAVYHYRVIAFTTDQYASAPSGAATITWATPAPSPSASATPAPTASARRTRSR